LQELITVRKGDFCSCGWSLWFLPIVKRRFHSRPRDNAWWLERLVTCIYIHPSPNWKFCTLAQHPTCDFFPDKIYPGWSGEGRAKGGDFSANLDWIYSAIRMKDEGSAKRIRWSFAKQPPTPVNPIRWGSASVSKNN
jgi:hypothetical protein